MVSMYDALNLAINFAIFTLTFVSVVVALMALNKKDK